MGRLLWVGHRAGCHGPAPLGRLLGAGPWAGSYTPCKKRVTLYNVVAGLARALSMLHIIEKTKEGGQSKEKLEKPQDGHHKSGPNIGNPYQMEDNKNPRGAAPKAPPCCLPFGEDFLCFGLISGAHPEAFPSFFLGGDCPTFLGPPIPYES